MIVPGSLAWASRWPLFKQTRQPHPFLVVQATPTGLFRCLGITHSADLFDRGGSVELTSTIIPTGYPPLVDRCVVGVKAGGDPAWIVCYFDGHRIDNHGDSIDTWGWRQLAERDWQTLRMLIVAAASLRS